MTTPKPPPTILVVEDEALIATELELRLGRMGYRVVGPCATADDAVATARAERPDLALMDLRLRGPEDGIDAATALKGHTPVVFLTAYADDATLARAKAVEPLGYLLKPFSEQLLRVTLDMALHSVRLDRERRAARAEADAARARSAAILDNTIDGILTIDAQDRIVQFNAGAAAMFGYPPEVVLGQPLDLLLPPGVRTAHGAHVAAFRDGRGDARSMAARQRVRGRRADGQTFPAAVSISTFERQGEVLCTAIVRDLTEIVQMEEALARRQTLEMVGRFASSVAHDMNNVLTAVFNSAFQLSYVEDVDEVREIGEQVMEAGRRGRALARRLVPRNLGHEDRGEALPVDVSRRITRMLPLLQSLVGVRIRLLDDITPGAIVHMDPVQLDQAILNLAVNARDAQPDGGEIRIAVRPGDPVQVEVADAGVGMDETTRARCLDPFFTTKPQGQGTGLGLANTASAVRQCGGTLHIDSTPGEGTTIRLDLPRDRAAVRGEDETEEISLPPDEDELRGVAVVVDDDDGVRRSTARLLQRLGYEVVQASCSGDALAAAATRGGNIDLLVTDFHLPYMDGVELAERIRRHRPATHCVVLTADPHAARMVSRDHRVKVVQKPYDARVLLAACRPPAATS